MISFIIPAHNEEGMLGGTLSAIAGSARGLDEPAEIIVVDDASTDRTAEIARGQGARVISVQCRQIAGARNAGAREAKGEWFIFVDADTTVNAGAVAAAIAAMRSGAVGGGCLFRFDGRVPLWGRIMLAVGEPLYRLMRLASGCFLFCTREAFEAVGGFDETLFAAEEAVLSHGLARKGRFVMLHERVVTSGRKLRTLSCWEVLATLGRIAVTGPNGLRRREGLEIWYGERRREG